MSENSLVRRYFVVLPVYGKNTYEPMRVLGSIELFPSMQRAADMGIERHADALVRDLFVSPVLECLSWEQFLFYAKQPGTSIDPLFALEIPKKYLDRLGPTTESKRRVRIRN